MRPGFGIVFIILLFFTAESCKHSVSKPVAKGGEASVSTGDNQPEISFTTTEHDFGKVTEGEKVGWYFTFHNTGGSDLLITNASASCGCTVPGYDREPVPPGSEGTVKVVFDSSGREGKQFKTVTIESNAKQLITKLVLKATVIKKE
ncbi:MAG TPA: DUF1573 domain-containing protein [Bacteroidales bacterium]|nr:DUF1573 domain-containing protein [Bacteroidales bacterium]